MPLKEEGRYYNFKGKKLKLYPISRLCTTLANAGYPRDSQTVRKWELSGVTPPAIFRSGQKRLYAQEQIDVFCETAQECDIKQGYSLAMTDFSQKMWERLNKVNKQLIENDSENAEDLPYGEE